MQLKISVVLPTYKRPDLLRKCLHQLANQTFDKTEYEIVIVSDGPDDASEQLVSEMSRSGNNLHFFAQAAKKGPAAARNLGWQKANAPLIAFTDDDCLPDASWLKNILTHYSHEAEIAYTGKIIVPVSDPPTDYELNIKGLETGDFVTANCVVTKRTLEAVGGFDEAFTAAWREDSDLEFKLLQRNVPIKKLEDALVVHPVREAMWGISIREQKKAVFNALLYKKYPQLFRQRIKSRPSWNYYVIVVTFITFAATLFLEAKWISVGALLICGCCISVFIIKRLSGTRKTASHIFEMIVTSTIVPFLSVYWTLYGSIKYRVLFF